MTGWYPNEYLDDDGDFVRYQANGLARAGHEVIVLPVLFSRFFWKRPFVKTHMTSFDQIKEFRTEGFVPTLRYNWAIRYANDCGINSIGNLKNHLVHADIVHLHNYQMGDAAIYLSKYLKVPLVYTEHSTDFLSKIIPKNHEALIQRLLIHASSVLAVGSGLAKKLKARGRDHVEVVGNYIDASIFNVQSIQPTDPFRLITVSSLIPRKRIEVLIECIGMLRGQNIHATLTIVGDGPLKKKLANLVENLGVQEYVSFLGKLPPKGVAEVLKQHSIYISASKTESFGVSYIEALACGLPVVAFQNEGVIDIVTNGSNGFIVKSASDMMEKVISINQSIAMKSKERISQQVLDKYDYVALADRHVKIYRSFKKGGSNI